MSPHRRDFIRLVGGGAVLASVPIAGCAALPDASAAWRHPGESESDPRRKALAYAILAPNPHNMQPWMADLSEPGAITLYADPHRLLPASDPFNRQILIGSGAFLELLRMTAAQEGLEAATTLFPQGEPQPRLDARPFARVVFEPGGTPDPLFAYALARRTSRIPFEPAAVPPAAAQRIIDAAHGDVAASFTLEPLQVASLKQIAYQGARIEAYTPDAQRETCYLTFIGARAVAAHRYGISLEGPAIEVAGALGLVTQKTMMTPGSFAFNQTLDLMRTMANSAAGFVWLTTPGNSRAEQIAAGRSYLRINTQAAVEGLAMHPWSQALQEYPSMAQLYARIHRELAPEGDRIQMFARIGHAKPVSPSPRRGLAAQIRNA